MFYNRCESESFSLFKKFTVFFLSKLEKNYSNTFINTRKNFNRTVNTLQKLIANCK